MDTYVLVFHCIGKQGEYRKCHVSGLSIEDSFDILNALVANGEYLIQAKTKIGLTNYTFLPVDAFDGLPMKEPLKTLQLEWEAILA